MAGCAWPYVCVHGHMCVHECLKARVFVAVWPSRDLPVWDSFYGCTALLIHLHIFPPTSSSQTLFSVVQTLLHVLTHTLSQCGT